MYFANKLKNICNNVNISDKGNIDDIALRLEEYYLLCENICDDIWSNIFMFLDIRSLIKLSTLSKDFNSLIDNGVKTYIFNRDFPIKIPYETRVMKCDNKDNMKTYKECFIDLGHDMIDLMDNINARKQKEFRQISNDLSKIIYKTSFEKCDNKLLISFLKKAINYEEYNVLCWLLQIKKFDNYVIEELLHELRNYKNMKIVELILKTQEYDINSPDSFYDSRTPIFFACIDKNYELAKLFVKYGARIDLICHDSSCGCCTLYKTIDSHNCGAQSYYNIIEEESDWNYIIN